MRLLLIEDDRTLCEFLEPLLQADGHAVMLAHTGPDGLAALWEGEFDGVILDRMLPGLDGLTVLQRLRAEGFALPVLLLTALGTPGGTSPCWMRRLPGWAA